jgi:outer membrane protein
MKTFFFNIGVVLLLWCTALPVRGDAVAPGADLWARMPSLSAELTAEPFAQASAMPSGGHHNLGEPHPTLGQFVWKDLFFVPNVCVLATPLKYEGTSIDDLRLDFGDETDSEKTAAADLNDLYVALYYGVPFVKTASRDTFNVDLGVNVRTLSLADNIDQKPRKPVSESVVLSIPMVFAAVQFHPLKAVALEAEGRGISIGGKKSYGLTGRLRWSTDGTVYAAGGYRYSKYEMDHNGAVVGAAINGPFIEAGLSF